MAHPLLVPRRRVLIELRLANGKTIDGEAYVAIDGSNGHQEHLVDRLNDDSERFIPVAVGHRHLLIRKASIVSMSTMDAREAKATRGTQSSQEIHVEVSVSVGAPLNGILLATSHSPHDRPLDHLNRLTRGFVALLDRKGITIVNTHHVVAVSERPAYYATASPTLDSSFEINDEQQAS